MAVAVRPITNSGAAGSGGAAAAAAAWGGNGVGGQRAGKGETNGFACWQQKRTPDEVRGVLLRPLLPWGLL